MITASASIDETQHTVSGVRVVEEVEAVVAPSEPEEAILEGNTGENASVETSGKNKKSYAKRILSASVGEELKERIAAKAREQDLNISQYVKKVFMEILGC
jgi:hypothetical protein